MSIEVIYRLRCDGEDCDATGPEASSEHYPIGPRKLDAEGEAAREGWARVPTPGGHRDLCPECVEKAKERKAVADVPR